MPGTPSMPFPATVISACPPHGRERLDRIAIERAARRDLRPGGRRRRRTAARTPGSSGRRRDQRARVQHLGAEVRQLRRLADVQLRDHPGVRHDPRVGGQQPRDVLPERHLRARPARARAASRSDRCRRGPSVATAPLVAVAAAVVVAHRSWRADESRHHRDQPGGQIGRRPLRAARSVSIRLGEAPPNGPSVNTTSVAST